MTRASNPTGISRRQFLRGAGAVGGAVGILGTGHLFDVFRPADAIAATNGQSLAANAPILIMVELAGGNDFLNTHIPHNVANVSNYYYQARPTPSNGWVRMSPAI